MTDPQKILEDLLPAEPLSENEFRQRAARYVRKKPWPHKTKTILSAPDERSYLCSKCGEDLGWDIDRTYKPKNKYCPIPDALDGPLEVWEAQARRWITAAIIAKELAKGTK